MESQKPLNPSQPPKEGCGAMIVWYLRACCYVGLAVGGIAFLIPNNMGFATLMVIVCGGFILLTRRKT